MKQVIIKCFPLIFILLFLSSCRQQMDEENISEEFYQTEKIENNDYQVEEVDFKALGIDHLSGIDFDDENQELYLSNRSKATVSVYDQDLKAIKTIQNDRMKFPSLLCKSNDFLYVLDDNTSQVFQFTDSAELVNIINLPSKESDSYYLDMSVWEGNIYLTLNTPNFEDSKIFKVQVNTGQVHSIKDKFIGFMYQDSESLLFTNSMVAFQESDQLGFKGGENHIYKLEGGKLLKQGDLLEGSFPGDFLLKDDLYYVYTSGWSSIDRYNSNFEYLDSIASFNESDFEAMLKGGAGNVFILMPNEQKLFKVLEK